MSKLVLLTAAAALLIVPLVDATAAMLAADALVVFLDGFETGDTSQWSQEVQ